jgi:hypothetical protein
MKMPNAVARQTWVLCMVFVACLAVGVQTRAADQAGADLVGTWLAPAPNAYLYPGQQIAGYPNSDAFTERFLFKRENGSLLGTFLTMSGNKPLGDLKVQGQTISFSQGRNKFHGQIKGNELQLSVNWDGESRPQPYVCRKATAEDMKIIEAGPTYSYN